MLARTGATPFGQGHVTTLSMVVADTLGIDMDLIEVVHGDTDEIPSSDITGGSRTAQIAGSALFDASEKLIEAARPLAADLLEAAAADVVLDSETGRFHVVGTPARSAGWADVAAAAEQPLFVENDFGQHGPTFPFGSHVAVVEVDAGTGEVTLERLVAVEGSTPAVQNAVVDALSHLGIRHLDMPASPQKVWSAMESAR